MGSRVRLTLLTGAARASVPEPRQPPIVAAPLALTRQSKTLAAEAGAYSETIDLTTYGRQRDRLREELTLAKIDHHVEVPLEINKDYSAPAERSWVPTFPGTGVRLTRPPPARRRVCPMASNTS